MDGSNEEDEADGVHSDGRGPFAVDHEAADSFARDEAGLDPVEFTGGKVFRDPGPFSGNGAHREVPLTVMLDFGGGNRGESMEDVEELEELVEHGFAKVGEVGLGEELFVGGGVVGVRFGDEGFGG